MNWHEDPYWVGRCLICGFLLEEHEFGKCPRRNFAQPVGIRSPRLFEALWAIFAGVMDRIAWFCEKRLGG